MKSRLLLATALTALSFSAFAADLPTRTVAPVAPAPIFSWTGFYVGGSLGLVNHNGQFSGSYDDNSYDGNFLPGSTARSSGIGAMVGVQAGYNYQMGQMVLGLEADYSWANAGKTTVNYGYYSSEQGSKLTSFGTVRARAGVAFDRALVYATGGFAFGNVKSNLYDDYEPLGYTTSSMRTGWTAGAGVEYALTNNVTLKAEGLYYALGSKTTANQIDGDSGYSSYKDKSDGVLARIGMNFKF